MWTEFLDFVYVRLDFDDRVCGAGVSGNKDIALSCECKRDLHGLRCDSNGDDEVKRGEMMVEVERERLYSTRVPTTQDASRFGKFRVRLTSTTTATTLDVLYYCSFHPLLGALSQPDTAEISTDLRILKI